MATTYVPPPTCSSLAWPFLLPHQKIGGASSHSPWIWVGLWLLQPTEHKGSEAVEHPTLDWVLGFLPWLQRALSGKGERDINNYLKHRWGACQNARVFSGCHEEGMTNQPGARGWGNASGRADVWAGPERGNGGSPNREGDRESR